MKNMEIGARFGRLVIDGITRQNGQRRVVASCDCGGTYEGSLYSVRDGHAQSCGCIKREMHAAKSEAARQRVAEMIGQKFGRLFVVSASSIEPGVITARCDCGTVWQGTAYTVRIGKMKSCGCLAREETVVRSTKHGKHKWPEYEAWRGAIRRCTKPNHKGWRYWGGRGIKVCDRWLHGQGGLSGLECFIADMGPRPSPKHSIDRIDNDGDYEPANCRWATRSEQLANQRKAGRFGDPDRVQMDSARVARLAALPPEKLAEFVVVRSGN